MRLTVRPLKKGELDEAAALMDRSWAEDYAGDIYFRYPADLLRFQFEREKGSIWMGAYWDGKLVGVNVSLPRWYLLDGQMVTGGIPTYLSVEPRFRRRGFAMHLIEAVVEVHRDRGDALVLPFFDAEGSGIKAYRKAFPRMQILWEGKWLVRLLDPDAFMEAVGSSVLLDQLAKKGAEKDGPSDSHGGQGGHSVEMDGGKPKKNAGRKMVRGLIAKALAPLAMPPPDMGPSYGPAGPGDAGALRKLLSRSSSGFQLHWNKAGMTRILDDPYSHVIMGVKKGKPFGAVVYQERTMVSRGEFKAAWIDGHWGDAKRRLDTVQAALGHAKERGCAAALWPCMGTAPPSSLLRAGFISFPRRFCMGAIGLNGYEPKVSETYAVDVR